MAISVQCINLKFKAISRDLLVRVQIQLRGSTLKGLDFLNTAYKFAH